MRFLVLGLVLFQSAVSAAQVTSNEMQHFTCGWGGSYRTISLVYDGPRYADGIYVSLEPKDVGHLRLPSDQLGVSEASIPGFMTMHSCEKNPEPGVLIRCSDRQQRGYGHNLVLKFEKKEKTPEGVEQNVQISRSVLIENLDILVRQSGNRAVLELSGQASNGVQKAIPLKITRNLGELSPVMGGCRFEPQSWYDR